MNVVAGFALINGTRLYYELAGEGEPLVLIHGFTLDRRMWDAQFEVFAQHYRVLRYDGPGLGKSDAPPDSSYDAVADLKALLDTLGIVRPHVLGLSMGGGTAIDFALMHPQMTRSLIVVDSVLEGKRWSAAWEAEARPLWQKGRSGDIEGARSMWLRGALFAPALANPLAAGPLTQIVTEYSGWHWLNGLPRGTSRASERLAELRMPVLTVVGERDLIEFREIADALEREAKAQKVVLPGVGHMSPMEAPDAFNRVVLEFLASV